MLSIIPSDDCCNTSAFTVVCSITPSTFDIFSISPAVSVFWKANNLSGTPEALTTPIASDTNL